MSTHETDIIVIGAGPVGLFAVFQCGMLGMTCHVVDALEGIGGQCSALYPEKPIYDIPAYPSVSGGELIAKLEEQAAPFDPVYHLDQRVEKVDKQADGSFYVETSKGTQINAKAVIIAAGVGAFAPKRPPLQGITDYEGTSVFYMVKKAEDFRDKNVVIAGGGDSALDWAIVLADIAKNVSVVHRRPKFRAAPESVNKMNALADAGKIDIVTPYQLAFLEGDGTQLTGVGIKTLEGEEKVLEADVLLPFFGLSQNLGPIADWGLQLEKKLIEIDPTTAATNIEGIFAIGDIATYPHKLKLILCGFSEAAMAAHSARSILHPDQDFHFEYSTSKGVPGDEKAA